MKMRDRIIIITKITPETAPAGARLLIKRYGMRTEDLFEITVVEWAPSGRAIKVRWLGGAESWETSLIDQGTVVEKLPSITQATCQNIDEDLDAALKRIWERYGNDLPQFFRHAFETYGNARAHKAESRHFGDCPVDRWLGVGGAPELAPKCTCGAHTADDQPLYPHK